MITTHRGDITVYKTTFNEPKKKILEHIEKYLKEKGMNGKYYIENDKLIREYQNSCYSITMFFLFQGLTILLWCALYGLGSALYILGIPHILSFFELPIIFSIIKITLIGMALLGFIFYKIAPTHYSSFNIYIKEINGQTIVRGCVEIPNSIEEEIMDFLFLKE